MSKDGRLLVYSDPVRGGLTLVPFDGSAAPRPLTDGTKDEDPSFTHDGQRVIFRRDTDGVAMIYAVPLTGGAAAPLTPGTNPEVARDADRVAFVRFAPGATTVFVTDEHGTTPVAVPNLDPGISEGAIALSPDGKKLLVATHDGPVIEIGTDGSDRRLAFPGRTDGLHTVAWAPDGDGLLATRVVYQGNLWIADGRFR